MYTLTQSKRRRGLPKKTVQIGAVDLENELRSHFKWTEGDLIHRMYNELSNTKYDNFITLLAEKGYRWL